MKKNQSGFVPVIIILVVLIGFVGVYFLGTLKNKPTVVNPTSSPLAVETEKPDTSKPTVKPTTDPTSKQNVFTMEEISKACIDLRNSSKYWDSKYSECNGVGEDKTYLQNFCLMYGGNFVANGDTCRHSQDNGFPCGPEATFYCSFK